MVFRYSSLPTEALVNTPTDQSPTTSQSQTPTTLSPRSIVGHVIEIPVRQELSTLPKSSMNTSRSFLRIEYQPTANSPLVANKYIEPPIVLHLTESSLLPLAKYFSLF